MVVVVEEEEADWELMEAEAEAEVLEVVEEVVKAEDRARMWLVTVRKSVR